MNQIFNELKENIYKYKYLIMTVVLIIFFLLSFFIFRNKTEVVENIDNMLVKNDSIEEKISSKIYIDIKGYVNKPGVYELYLGKRVIDAIDIAGGLKKGANTRFINLSKILNDGEVIVIYSDAEIKEAKKSNTIVVETPCVCEEIKNDACYLEKDDNNETVTVNGKVNINTSTLSELMTLSGIGESKAQAIIDYRNKNGLFKSIEDIVNVSGISELTYAKIKENITV